MDAAGCFSDFTLLTAVYDWPNYEVIIKDPPATKVPRDTIANIYRTTHKERWVEEVWEVDLITDQYVSR